MEEPRGIVKLSLALGQLLLFGLKLQVLWVWYTLRGGIVLGFFQALASVVKLLLRRFEQPTDQRFAGKSARLTALNTEFKTFWQASFSAINVIGYISFAALALLYIDLAVNQRFIHSTWLQYGLVVLLVMGMIYWQYILTVFARYQLSLWQYFRQAFIISLARFFDTLAIIVGTMIATTLIVLFPILSLTALVPLYLTPMVWFSLHACRYVEAVIQHAQAA